MQTENNGSRMNLFCIKLVLFLVLMDYNWQIVNSYRHTIIYWRAHVLWEKKITKTINTSLLSVLSLFTFLAFLSLFVFIFSLFLPTFCAVFFSFLRLTFSITLFRSFILNLRFFFYLILDLGFLFENRELIVVSRLKDSFKISSIILYLVIGDSIGNI